MSYTVCQVAELAGVTVRTLHHYDAIGLLAPRARTRTGHRRYTVADLERLQQILFYRELGLPLEEIAALLDDPYADAAAHLRRQRRLLTQRIARLQAMVAAVERALEAQTMGISLTPEERFEVFGDFRPEEYAPEAVQRWGESEAFKESQRRTARYGKDDWLRISAESGAIEQGFTEALTAGLATDSARALELAEAHRQHISRWFYDLGYAMHRGLAEMYIADPRFAEHYDRIAPGLARFVHDAILANATRRES